VLLNGGGVSVYKQNKRIFSFAGTVVVEEERKARERYNDASIQETGFSRSKEGRHREAVEKGEWVRPSPAFGDCLDPRRGLGRGRPKRGRTERGTMICAPTRGVFLFPCSERAISPTRRTFPPPRFFPRGRRQILLLTFCLPRPTGSEPRGNSPGPESVAEFGFAQSDTFVITLRRFFQAGEHLEKKAGASVFFSAHLQHTAARPQLIRPRRSSPFVLVLLEAKITFAEGGKMLVRTAFG